MQSNNSADNEKEALGFDPLTILTGLRLKFKHLIFIGFFSAVLGILAALTMGQTTWQSETILRYKKVGENPTMGETNFLVTQLSLVKLPANLEATRQILGLPSKIENIGRAIEVTLQRNTSLLIIKGTWSDPALAASLTATIRDVFLENTLKIRQQENQKKQTDVESRLNEVIAELKTAEKNLQDFTISNNVIDLDKEAQWYLEQMISTDLLYEQAQIEEKTIGLQVSNLGKIIDNLKQRVAEEAANSSTMENLGDLNIKMQRLKDAIHEDKTHRAAQAELKQRELEYNQAQELFNRRLIAAAEVEKAKNAFERQKALTVDTEKTSAWKKDLDGLHQRVLPNKGEDGPAGTLLKSMMLKSFELDLESVAVKDKVEHLKAARARVKEKLDKLPTLQRDFVKFSREVAAREAEKKILEAELVAVKSSVESKEYDFTVVSQPAKPVFPHRSNRRIIAISVTSILFFAGLMLLIGLEFLDTSIKSERDCLAKLDLELLGVLSSVSPSHTTFPGEKDSVLVEQFRIIAQQLRTRLPDKGTTILVVSAEECEGRTMVTTNLACCFGRTDERVLMIDAQVRNIETNTSIKDFILTTKDQALRGLGDYLSFRAQNTDEIVFPTSMARVSAIPRVGEAVIPDLINSNRMKELLNQICNEFSIILVDSPPVTGFVDADILCTHATAVLLIIRSRKTQLSAIKKAIKRIRDTRTPIIGVILTDVNKIYL
ncbi:MAG: polysaccharide biosynthesis tyrosine autokinase [Candidatus Rifleibacteriota bacterium]